MHDLFASHKDSSFSINDSKDQQIGWAGFRCNCENLVVESPFIENHFPKVIEITPAHSAHYTEDAVSFLAAHKHDSHLRGPPSIMVC